jgi:hypothetical protein
MTERQKALTELIDNWKPDAARHNVGELEIYNTERFPQTNADVRALKRTFDEVCNNLQSGVQLCRIDCASCRLPCLLIRHHEGVGHDCGTSHRCLDSCEFTNEHEDNVLCGLP